MPGFFRTIDDEARFSATKAARADLFRGGRLFVGLNCFEPGQSQAAHTHAGADKFYLLVSGKARMTVGRETRIAEAGTVVWAPADLPHGVDEALERTVMLVAIAPPPAPKSGGAEEPGSR
ncbi:MAG TPA: cupin domain-containing protein [Gemmatimonadales bacterium]|nr:cupin domain-containing protein [Gemmatimonadales bacterium]